jgi:hypothetical protein
MLASSCIIPDKCIYYLKEGYRWEVVLSGKGKDPDTGQPLTIPGVGFDCFTPDENALLVAEDENNQDFSAMRNGLLVAAQMDCLAAGAGFNEVKCDPFDAEDNLQWLLVATPDEKCILKNTYENECPEYPDMTEGVETTTTETTTTTEPTTTESVPTTTDQPKGADTGVPTTTAEPDPCDVLDLTNWISCTGNTCQVDEVLIATLSSQPTFLACDTTRLLAKIEASVVVGMYFDNVQPNGLADMLGFEEDDVILAVEGLPFASEEDFAAIAIEIANADEATVTIKRGMNTIDLTFERI